jgi:hypothetical protein
MPNTNQAHEFASIDTVLLADVQGGCGRKRRRCGGGCNTVINNIQQAPAAAPAAAPAPGPSGGPQVDVNVGYQQAAG